MSESIAHLDLLGGLGLSASLGMKRDADKPRWICACYEVLRMVLLAKVQDLHNIRLHIDKSLGLMTACWISSDKERVGWALFQPSKQGLTVSSGIPKLDPCWPARIITSKEYESTGCLVALTIEKPRYSVRDPNSDLHGEHIVAFASLESAQRKEKEYLKFDPGLEASRARVTAVNEFFTGTRDPAWWPNESSGQHSVQRRELTRGFLVRHGFPSLFKGSPLRFMKDFAIKFYQDIPQDFKTALAVGIGRGVEARLSK